MPATHHSVTAIPVMYRDGHNYKKSRTLLFAGAITPEQTELLRASLDEGVYFIPTQVGLRHLGHAMESFPNDADHSWHELLLGDIEVTTVTELPDDLPDLNEFLSTMRGAAKEGWDEFTAALDLNIPMGA